MSTVEEILAPAPAQTARRGTAARRAARILRPGRAPAGVAVAAVTAVTAWWITAEVVEAWLAAPREWSLAPGLLELTWRNPAMPYVAGAALAVGALLVILAVIPGRPRLVPLETVEGSVVIGITRQGLRRTLAAAALGVTGADLAYVRLQSGQIEVTVVTDARRTGDLLREVGAAVGDRLQTLALYGRHEVVVRLRRRRI
ncbi:DUF6286 domain-containing protein [Acrocarpospora catenulata]|uniref:DUF6286 domain-containing protein n=1 Tax=Acrocarpospora catenulata TaxID=2836182 RepID=UPI001BDA306D|nr:DUF6286 domain-containing protein [Acrocarpospora catenulata]